MKFRRNLFCCLLPVLVLGLIGGTPGCSQTTNSIPAELRQGNFSCDKATIQTALELTRAGWTYIMPEPKSPQAAWGNTDGRTTWWIGYWINSKDNSTSLARPKKDADGHLAGDGNGGHIWRRGGSPPPLTKIEWLCSKFDGVPPQ
jgi:hypothetical protein